MKTNNLNNRIGKLPIQNFIIVIALLTTTIGLPACEIDVVPPGPIENAVAALSRAIDALNTASADWQVILQNVEAQLTDAAQRAIRVEVSNTLNRAIQAANSHLLCDIDFLRVRVREDLIRIRAGLRNEPILPVTPVICGVTPDPVIASDNTPYLTLDGYNFDIASPFQVLLNEGNQNIDESSHLHITTHYKMTLDLGDSGIHLSPNSHQLLISWQGQSISDIGIIHSTPTCETDMIPVPSKQFSFIPPHTTGDAEFSGNGPEIWVDVMPSYDTSQANVLIKMRAIETNGGDTRAEGSQSYQVYQPEPGWKIQSIDDASIPSRFHYIDTNTDKDTFFTGEGWASQFDFVGDSKGNDAGYNTAVTVTLKELKVHVQKVGDCNPKPPVTPPPSAPKLSPIARDPNIEGAYILSWNSVDGADAYELQEQNPSGNWSTIYNGNNTSYWWQINQGLGNYAFHVRASNAGGTSDWSNPTSLKVKPTPTPHCPVKLPNCDLNP